MNTNKTRKTFRKVFRLLDLASNNGGLFVSAAGGTANVLAGELSRALNISYEDAHKKLAQFGAKHYQDEEWYACLAYQQPYNVTNFTFEDVADLRWDVRTIAKAALR